MGCSRSAFWIGQARVGQEDALKAIIRDDLVPAMRAFPGILDAAFLWPRGREDGAPPIFFQSILIFADQAALGNLSTSPARAAVQSKVQAALALFDGVIRHINFENL
jgi:hypothetical protein